jgi:hypothetical protein
MHDKPHQVNPDFGDEVDAAVGGDASQPIILYCSQGGSLEGGGALKRGLQTRCARRAAGPKPPMPCIPGCWPAAKPLPNAVSAPASTLTPPRSLIAAYELVQRGYSKVAVMKGGYFEWAAAGRDVEGAAAGGGGGGAKDSGSPVTE